MKKLLSLTFLLLLAASSLFAQDKPKEQRKSPHDTVRTANMTIAYGRPYKKGRVIFGGLEAYGKVWRAGADEATQITFAKDCKVVGRPVKAGTYTLFVIPGKNEWTLLLNSKLGQWGAYDYDKTKDVLTAAVAAATLDNVVEQFTIEATADAIKMMWDKTSVTFPVTY